MSERSERYKIGVEARPVGPSVSCARRMKRLILAAALGVAGCATGGVADRDVARLPVEDRAQIQTAQKSIEVARSNMAAAKSGHDEAVQFRTIAQTELDAAKSRLDAARSRVDLGRSARDDRKLREADRNEEAARNQLIAARAKLDYADRLIELREAKVEASEADLAAASADVEMTKLRLLQRNNIDAKVDAKKLEAAQQDGRWRLAETRARVAELEGDVAQLKTAWDDRRREMYGANSPAPNP
jgi:chromosome segregation ATPase